MNNLNQKYLVSVIIPNYNYDCFLEEAVLSVLNQTYTNLECIVVDDGSTDNSAKLCELLMEKDARLRLIRKTNGGLPSTRNEGIKNSKGDLICFLDADDIWKTDKLENQIKVLIDTKADVVFSNCEEFNKDRVIHQSDFQKETVTFYDLLGGNIIPGSSSNLMMKKEVVEKVGFFNNDLRSAEDLDYYYRIALAGFKYQFVPSLGVSIRKHENSMQANFVKMFYNKNYCFDLCFQNLINAEIQVNNSELKKALLVRFQSMLWTARDCQRDDLIQLTYTRTRNLYGFRFYFSRSYWKNKRYDTIQKLVKRKKQLFK